MMSHFRIFVLAAALGGIATVAHAQQNSFSITPPPIVAPTFEAGKTEGKVRFTYLSMEGNGTEFTGGGVDAIGRKAFSGSFAGDFQGGLFVLGGDMATAPTSTTKISTTMMNLLFGVNGEFQAYKGDVFSALLFAGPNTTFLFGTYDMTIPCGLTATCTDTITVTGNLFGLQAGIQFGISLGDFSFDPFAMISSQSGSMTSSSSYGGSQTVTIDAFSTTSFGIDITYKPWNLSLSAILQEAEKQSNKDKEGMKTSIYQISLRF